MFTRTTHKSLPHPKRALIALLGLLGALMLVLSACSVQLGNGICTPGKGTSVPAQIAHGDQGSVLVIVQVTIQGQGPYAFALDTGASVSLIDQHLANTLQLPVAGSARPVSGIGGSEDVTPVQISRWSMGTVSLPSMSIVSGAFTQLGDSASVEGLLGSDVLSRLGAVTIDYDTSTVTITN